MPPKKKVREFIFRVKIINILNSKKKRRNFPFGRCKKLSQESAVGKPDTLAHLCPDLGACVHPEGDETSTRYLSPNRTADTIKQDRLHETHTWQQRFTVSHLL